MNTILYLEEILSFYGRMMNCGSEDEQKQYMEELVAMLNKMLYRFPHLLHPIANVNMENNQIMELIQNFKSEVSNSYVPIFPSGLKYIDVINSIAIETPIFNIWDKCNSCYIEEDKLNDYLLNIVLSMPINKINITFVELEDNFVGDYFYKNINPKIYHQAPITDEDGLKEYIEKQKKRTIDIKIKYGNYFKYCIDNQIVPIPYEVMVISENNTSWFDSYNSELESLLAKSKDIGFYIIRVKNKTDIIKSDLFALNYKLAGIDLREYAKEMNSESYCFDEIVITKKKDDIIGIIGVMRELGKLLSQKVKYPINPDVIGYNKKSCVYRGEYASKDIDLFIKELYSLGVNYVGFTANHVKIKRKDINPIIKCTPLTEKKNLLNAFVAYINSEADKKEESIVLKLDFEKSASKTYEKTLDSITVPIGKSSNTEVNVTMDMVSHVHSFIIGQSGSGKSVFLHNIIGSAILKYAPEDLQLYLLDFKLGGVEFNRYKGIKHVKSLLVDNSDQQITLEILRELRERMVERGRQLRDCSVNNLVEYNKQNPNATMPQILVVVDECHEMFRVGSDIPRTVSNEISEIITKIAKEGRSQGVHLILATQTLSGTEISNEILNNVSDHYLLKCATSDSERMVERSSEITSKLSTGQIYYHHVDSQVQFQAYYTDKVNAAKLIDLAKKKAENHQSNGEFYFNGSQLFKLDTTVMEQGKKRAKYPIAYMGRNISINQNDLNITLRKDYSENILLFGLNDVEQVTRTTMNLFISLISYTQSKGLDYKFKVFNCLSNEDSIYTEQLELLEEEGYCEIIEGRKDRGKFLKQLAEDISNETVENTILLILGQERFRELKMDMEISNEKKQESSDDAFGFGGFSFSNEGTSSSSIKTFKQALELILDKGPELGVHTIMQLDKPSNFLFSDYISPKLVYQKFKHLIMLKSDESASAQLHLNDNIRLEALSKDLERLRAYYYSEESDTYTLFTPYMELSNDEIINLLKSE